MTEKLISAMMAAENNKVRLPEVLISLVFETQHPGLLVSVDVERLSDARELLLQPITGTMGLEHAIEAKSAGT